MSCEVRLQLIRKLQAATDEYAYWANAETSIGPGKVSEHEQWERLQAALQRKTELGNERLRHLQTCDACKQDRQT